MLPVKNAKTKLAQLLPFNSLDRDLKIIFLSNLLAAFGDGFVVFLLPLFIRSINATAENVGLLFTLSSLAAAVTMIPGGFLADKYSRKKIMIAGWALWIPIPLCFFFATDWVQLLIPMLIYGITFSAPAVSAYVLEHSREKAIATAFTTLGAAYAIGYIFSPVTAGFLSSALGTRSVFVFTAVFYSLAALVLVWITGKTLHKPSKCDQPAAMPNPVKREPTRAWKLAAVSALFAAMMFVVSLVSTLVPQFLSDVYNYSEINVIYLGTPYYIGGFLLSLVVGKIGDRYSKTSAIIFSMLLMSLSLAVFVLTDNLGLQVGAAFLRGASFPMWAYIGVMAGSIAPEGQRARWISVAQTTTRVAIISAPFIGGLLYTSAPLTPFIFATTAALAISLLVNHKVFKN